MARLSSTDPVTFRLTADGDLDLTGGRATMVAGAEAFVQGVRSRLELVRGQFYLNRAAGTPWIENPWVPPADAIMGQPYAPQKLRRAFDAQFARTPGAFRVTEFGSTFDGRSRKARVSARGKCVFADVGIVDAGTITQEVG